MSKGPKRTFSKEFKEDAVKLVIEQDYKVSEAARNLGIGANLLSRWKREIENQDDPESLSLDEKAELKRLREECRQLKMEREILKKAAAFFVKEMK